MYTSVKRKWQEGQGWASIALTLVVAACIIGGIYAFASCSPVDPGQVKVVKQFGEIVRVNTEGLNWITPLIQTTETYDIRTKTYEVSNNPDTSKADYPDYAVSAQTTDGQQISINYTVKFRVDATQIATIVREFGNLDAVVENIVKADSRSWVRKLAQEYEAEALFSGAGILLFEDQVHDMLEKIYEGQNVILVEFLVRKIDFDATYVQTIEDQQIAQEQILTAEFQAQAAIHTAQQAVEISKGAAQSDIERARGSAEARVIAAEADALAVVIAAQAEADAIALRGKALDRYPIFIEFELIKNLDAKWVLDQEMFLPFLPLE